MRLTHAICVMLMALCLMSARTASAEGPVTSESPTDFRQEAIDLFGQGRVQEALPLLRELLRLNPQDPTALIYMGIYNVQKKEPLCRQAAASFLTGDYRGALEKWEEIVKMDPADTRVLQMMNMASALSDRASAGLLMANVNQLMDAGEYRQAARELEKLLTLTPEDAKARELLASLQVTLKNNLVMESYDRAAAYFKLRQYDLAIAEWEGIIKANPDQELAKRLIESTKKKLSEDMHERLRQEYSMGRFVSARDMAGRLLAADPGDRAAGYALRRITEVLNVMPEATATGKQWDMIRKSTTAYIDQDGDARIAVLAAWYAAEIAPKEAATAALKEFMESKNITALRTLPPQRKDMNVVEHHLYLALERIYEGKYDQAAIECNLVLKLEPDNLLAMKRLGSAYYLMGSQVKAAEIWNHAILLAPKDEELNEFIGLVTPKAQPKPSAP